MHERSRAQTTARHSPSTGTYRLSTGVVALDLAKTNCHPFGQHDGVPAVGHVQCCCHKRNPMPSLLQSAAMYVLRVGSKLCTPSYTLAMISCLEDWNRLSSSFVHWKVEPLLWSNCLKGSKSGCNLSGHDT